MFVRKKKNSSGVISVQIIDKSSGKYKVLKTIGSSASSEKVEELFKRGKRFIQSYQGQQSLNLPDIDFLETVKSSIKSINIAGINLLLGQIYTSIGFNKVNSELLKQLVIIRLTNPASKLKTTQYLKRYFSIEKKLRSNNADRSFFMN